MSAPTINDCINDVKSGLGPMSSREEVLRILRSVKRQREFIDREIAIATNVSHSFTVTTRICDGCE